MQQGDRVRLIDICEEWKNPNYPDDPDLRTAELARLCLNREFTVRGFDRYGYVEIEIDEDSEIARQFGRHGDSLWLNPDLFELIGQIGPGESLAVCERCGGQMDRNRVRCQVCFWPFEDGRPAAENNDTSATG